MILNKFKLLKNENVKLRFENDILKNKLDDFNLELNDLFKNLPDLNYDPNINRDKFNIDNLIYKVNYLIKENHLLIEKLIELNNENQ